MPDLRDTQPDRSTMMDRAWFGVLAADVPDFTHLAPVIIPEFSDELIWGPARWQARDATTLPRKGNACLVVFDNRRQPWITAWWPF